MTQEPLTLPLDLPESVLTCWYCGGAGPFEQEHQLPISRGGRGGTTVRSCMRCNALKGPLDVEEFREGLAERLALRPPEVVFAGEATPQRLATSGIPAVRSLAADRSVVRIDPAVGEELHRAWRYLRTAGDQRLTRRALASAAIEEHLEELRRRLELGEDWPGVTLHLFDIERAPLTGRTDLSQTARVPMERQHTKVPGELLDHARAGVEYRRAHGEPELTLLTWIGDAVRAALAADAARLPGYPCLNEAITRRYGATSAG